MSDPPPPPPTNPDGHAPGISKTLEEGGSRAREVHSEERTKKERREEKKGEKDAV